ncbi:transcriptional regulator, GntR family [Dehalobacter sp. UNSWDHB]|uniref:GntR family transcriptional regulator n=1 Tax=unclassified Dehalobacter TaxID=2635733 RepID=UPI00028A5A9E|nr:MULTISPECIES: GntR family transcriptional regulator [unclassified Dehalobacter]AFV03045.1 transcriptional regulator, GntR family [Dehalobacter sp. DCA]AFV06033.1 transcriptional regulator, GntR family [Dehalobacter sp. CF]EQB22172.1 transcriptional regulator, GntR family [Dehalobacter sp. UNSWDHB]
MIQLVAYNIVYEDIKRKIVMGTYRPGDKIPSINELCKIYHTSDLTIRKSLKLLQKDGLITTVKRIGVFVSELTNKKYTLHFHEKTSLKSEIDSEQILNITRYNEFEQADCHELKGTKYISIERICYTNNVLPILYRIDSIVTKVNNNLKKEKAHIWVKQMDIILNSDLIRKQIKLILDNEHTDIKKKLYLPDQMGMYRIQKKYFTEEGRLFALSDLYIPSSDIDVTLHI